MPSGGRMLYSEATASVVLALRIEQIFQHTTPEKNIMTSKQVKTELKTLNSAGRLYHTTLSC